MDRQADTEAVLAPELTNCSSFAEQPMPECRGTVPTDQPEAIVFPAEWHFATLAG